MILLGTMVALALASNAQTAEVDAINDDNVQLEIITADQPEQLTEQETKEREKRLRELQDEAAFAKAANSLRRGYFVMLVDNVQFSNGGFLMTNMDQRSNFILVQNFDGIVQFTPMTNHPGINGLGGWTAKGSVRDKRIKYLDNGDVYMEFHLTSNWINTTITITLFHNSKQAVAYLAGPNIRVYGEILPYRDKEHR